MPFPRTISTYEPRDVRVAFSALMEVAAALQAYREAMVLIGGWVPYLLLQQHQSPGNPFRHVGSLDSDWVIDPRKIDEGEYDTIVKMLKRRGFVESREIKYRLTKGCPVPGKSAALEVAVDLLTRAPQTGRGKPQRHRRIQPDLAARAADWADVALSHSCDKMLDGELSGGGNIQLPIRMADVVGLVGTKGLALGRRYEEKDNYDLYAVIANYGEGPVEVARMVKPFARVPSLRPSLEKIRTWYADVNAAGPAMVARFYDREEGDARLRRIRDAFEILDRFLQELGLRAADTADGPVD